MPGPPVGMAADGSIADQIVPFLGLLGIALTAAVTFITTWRWRTLAHRLREHLDLLKDVPTGHGEPLAGLVDEEVRRYADRERRRLEDPIRAHLLSGFRASLALALTLLLAGAVVASYWPGADPVLEAADTAGSVLFTLALFALLSVWLWGRWRATGLRIQERSRRRAARRGAVSERPGASPG